MCLIISRGGVREEGEAEVWEKVTECSVTYIEEETFCFKSDLAVEELRIAPAVCRGLSVHSPISSGSG